MSRRTLQRQFAQSTGLAPIDWLFRARVAYAKEILQACPRASALHQPRRRFGRIWLGRIAAQALPPQRRLESHAFRGQFAQS
jgi:AraC family transcriptional activator FtrA